MRGSLDLNIFMEFEDEKMEDKIRMESYMVGLSPWYFPLQNLVPALL